MPMLYQNHPGHFVINKFDRLYGKHISLLLPVFHFSLLTRTLFFFNQAYFSLAIFSVIGYYGFLVPD